MIMKMFQTIRDRLRLRRLSRLPVNSNRSLLSDNLSRALPQDLQIAMQEPQMSHHQPAAFDVADIFCHDTTSSSTEACPDQSCNTSHTTCP